MKILSVKSLIMFEINWFYFTELIPKLFRFTHFDIKKGL